MTSPCDLAVRIWQLSQTIVEGLAQELGNLPPKSYFLLAHLQTGRSVYPAELARVLGMPPPTVTYLLKQLEEGGFLVRKVEPDDLRKYRLALTPKGRRAVREGDEKSALVIQRSLAKLDPTEIRLFEQFVGRLTQVEPARRDEGIGTVHQPVA